MAPIPITTQVQLEELLCGYDYIGNPGPKRFMIWFSAAWCGPCQKMDKVDLEAAAKEVSLPFYYCDEVVVPEAVTNCGITSFPTFVIYGRKEVLAKRVSADTTKVCQWIRKYGLAK